MCGLSWRGGMLIDFPPPLTLSHVFLLLCMLNNFLFCTAVPLRMNAVETLDSVSFLQIDSFTIG